MADGFNGLKAQTDFNNCCNSIGGSVVVYSLNNSTNIYGDLSLSGANLYVSGVTAIAYFEPRDSSDNSIQEFSNLVDGDMIGYFKSGTVIELGYRISGTSIGDYKVNALSPFPIGEVIVYNSILMDTLFK